MSKTIFKTLLDSLPEQNLLCQYSSHSFVGVETDSGPGIAMNMYPEQSLSMAMINAYYNQGRKYYEPFDNYCTSGLDFEGKTVGVIGHMKGVSKRYGDIAKKIYIFEMEPKDEDDYPAEMEDELLPTCDIVVITGSAIINETVDHILDITRHAYRIIVGPSVPMCEDLLDFGFDRLSGMVVSDVEKMRAHLTQNLPGSPYYFGETFLISKDR